MSVFRKIKQWHWRLRRRLAVWLAEVLYVADMLWDDDDPETPYYSVEEWASNEWGGAPGASTTVTFRRAIELPNKFYRVTAHGRPDSDEIDYQCQQIPQPLRRPLTKASAP
jgi:hypothetical protein